MSGTHNILVISDLHLGEDLTPSASPQVSRDLRLAERHLIAFLSKYTRRRADGRPWRLVINGDMVDFLGICVFPDHPALHGAWCSADEREHGLERRRDATCAKVDAVVEHHVEFFRALARFIAGGNAVEIVCGNHDAEFYWPEVQEALRQAVARVWQDMPAAQRPGAMDGARVGEAIQFHPWFFYEPGVAWIEHGHQFDECCSFEYNLDPVNRAGDALVTNVDTAGMRYVTNQCPEGLSHGTEEWSFAGYLRFAMGLGLGGGWRLARGYYRFAATLIREWRGAHELRTRRARRVRHEARLDALGRSASLPADTLRALGAMHRAPVTTNLRKLTQVLMLDKLLISLATLVVVLAALIWLPMAWALATTTSAIVGSHYLSRRLGQGRSVDATLPLQVVPARILERVDARFVVFGHTHLPVAQPVPTPAGRAPAEGGRWYFNTGTWMPIGKQGLLRSFTHVVIRHAPHGPVASLCQWRDGASREFTPDWSPAQRPEPARPLRPVPRPVGTLHTPDTARGAQPPDAPSRGRPVAGADIDIEHQPEIAAA